ncbi:MAG: hypothetical protein ACLRWQ_01550 [Flavonifractor plautii]
MVYHHDRRRAACGTTRALSGDGLAGRSPGHLLPVAAPPAPSGVPILFGGLLILYLRMPIDLIPDQIYKILPYVVTVIVLVFTSMRNNRDKQPPASLGLAYFREER